MKYHSHKSFRELRVEHKNKRENTLLGIPTEFAICLFLGLFTLAVYWPVMNYEFINFDDDAYVTDNYYIHKGLTSKSISWAFTATYVSNWHPLTWLSHILDVQLFGLKPGFHHLSNVFFHIANALMLFLVLRRMTKGLWQSAFVAAFFAFHPLHVESVAWVSERKDVLSTFFWIMTMWGYCRYVERPGTSRYILVAFFFMLGLMAKPMLVTLPFVLLLLDYWPFKRFQFGQSGFGKLVLEKTPLFIFSAASCIITYFAQQSGGAVASFSDHTFTVRITNALISYAIYIGKTIWPFDLAVLYPYQNVLPWWQVAGACVLVISVSILVIRVIKHRPYLAVGWLWYLGTLIPVIGLVQVGLQAMADRYTYVPLIGLFIMIAWGIPDLFKNLKPIKRIFIGIAGALFFVIIPITWKQVQYWENSITLFRHTIDVTTNNAVAHTNLAQALLVKGNLNEAKRHLYAAIKINPNFVKAYGNLGFCLLVQHKPQEAIVHYEKALSLNPDFPEAANNLAWIYATHKNQNIRNGKKAVELAEHAVEVLSKGSPKILEILDTLAAAYAEIGQYKKATQIAQKALELSKTYGNSLLAAEIQKRVLLYDSGMPFRET